MASPVISNRQDVEAYFGYWPHFSDGRVVAFAISDGAIQLSIRYIDATSSKAAEVHIRFSGVSDIDLNQLADQNILDELLVDGDGPYAVSLEACCGVNGRFKCQAIEVLDVLPYTFPATAGI